MDFRAWISPLAVALAATLAGAFAGCEAELVEDCTSGICGGATIAAATVATAASGGGGGGSPDCLFPDTGELPCEVFTILDSRCHKCHQEPPLNNAPFPLLTWSNFQELYGDKPRWERAATAVEPGAIPQMPFGEDPLPEAQLVVLRAWFDTCRAGACAKEPVDGAGGAGQGGSGGAGGSGGSGGSGGADVVVIPECEGVADDDIAAEVSGAGTQFTPDGITLPAGSVLRFTPEGAHTFTADDDSFTTDVGATVCLRFLTAGTYPFHCSNHPSVMTGTVTVE